MPDAESDQAALKESVKTWLSRKGYTREWLAKHCSTEKRTVDNWLSSPRPIPAKALRIIESLMRKDAEVEGSAEPQLSHLTLRITTEELNDWARAYKASDAETFEEWTIQTIRNAYLKQQKERNGLGNFEVVQEPQDSDEMTELLYYGTVAAGLPGGITDISDETRSVPDRGYDRATHYVLRVNGQSMEPDYPDGSLIICRRLKDGEFAKKGDDVIASDANGSYFKRLEYRKDGKKGNEPRKPTAHLVSINSEFPEVTPVSDTPINSVVVDKF